MAPPLEATKMQTNRGMIFFKAEKYLDFSMA